MAKPIPRSQHGEEFRKNDIVGWPEIILLCRILFYREFVWNIPTSII